MTFSLSGSSIVVDSGTTNTSLSGIEAIAGVSVTSLGWKNLYTVTGNLRLEVDGDLTIDPAVEILAFTSASTQTKQVRIDNGGTLTLGSSSASSFGLGDAVLFGSTAIISSKDGPGSGTNGGLSVENGGTLEIYGAGFECNGVINFNVGCNVTIRDGSIYTNNGDGNGRIRCSGSANLDIDGLKLYNLQFDWLSDDAFSQFVGLDARNRGIPIENAGGTNGVVRRWDSMPDNRGTTGAVMNNWVGRKDVQIYGHAAGSLAIIVPDNTNPAPVSPYHGGRIFQPLKVRIVDSTGANISTDARFFMRDTDNGSRVEANMDASSSVDETADRTYDEAFGATGTPQMDVLIAMWYRNNDCSDLSEPDGNEVVDLRSVSGVQGTDDFVGYFRTLAYQFAFRSMTLRSQFLIDLSFELVDDENWSGTARATIDAWTEFNLDDLYDRAKSFNIDNPEVPAINQQIITGVGSTADTGAYRLVFGSGFSVASTDITFNPKSSLIGTKFTSVTSSGDAILLTSQADADAIQGITFTGDIVVDGATALTLDGVTGNVRNDSSSPLTVTSTNGSSLTTAEPGTGNGQVSLVNAVTVSVTAVDTAGSPIQDARVYVAAGTGGDLSEGTVILSGLTNASGVYEDTAFNFTNNQNVTGRVRKASSSPYYKTGPITGTINSAGFQTTIQMASDE